MIWSDRYVADEDAEAAWARMPAEVRFEPWPTDAPRTVAGAQGLFLVYMVGYMAGIQGAPLPLDLFIHDVTTGKTGPVSDYPILVALLERGRDYGAILAYIARYFHRPH